jgi:hypothetical protein
MCLEYFERQVNTKKSEKNHKLVANAHKTLQHIVCAFTTKLIGVWYKNIDRTQHRTFREKNKLVTNV